MDKGKKQEEIPPKGQERIARKSCHASKKQNNPISQPPTPASIWEALCSTPPPANH